MPHRRQTVAVPALRGIDRMVRNVETLASIDGPVQFVLLDGWKDLYVAVLELLEPRLAPGALVVADNTSMPGLQPYLDYVRDPANGYVSVHFPVRDSDSMEISCRA